MARSSHWLTPYSLVGLAYPHGSLQDPSFPLIIPVTPTRFSLLASRLSSRAQVRTLQHPKEASPVLWCHVQRDGVVDTPIRVPHFDVLSRFGWWIPRAFTLAPSIALRRRSWLLRSAKPRGELLRIYPLRASQAWRGSKTSSSNHGCVKHRTISLSSSSTADLRFSRFPARHTLSGICLIS